MGGGGQGLGHRGLKPVLPPTKREGITCAPSVSLGRRKPLNRRDCDLFLYLPRKSSLVLTGLCRGPGQRRAAQMRLSVMITFAAPEKSQAAAQTER